MNPAALSTNEGDRVDVASLPSTGGNVRGMMERDQQYKAQASSRTPSQRRRYLEKELKARNPRLAVIGEVVVQFEVMFLEMQIAQGFVISICG